MIETVVIATDGSASVKRAVTITLDLARRFEATVHGVYVVDAGDVAGAPQDHRKQLRDGLEADGEDALAAVKHRSDLVATTAVREGDPAREICTYAREHDADVVAVGTRGRHGEHRFLLGSVAEEVIKTCPVPVLTVRQLASNEADV